MRRALPRSLAVLGAITLLSACQEEAPAGEAIPVPSGRTVTLIDVVTNARGPEGATARFRFLAPDLTQDDVEAAAADLQALCDSYAIGRIEGMVPPPEQIIVSLSAAEVPFGEAAPDVVQFFESFRPENGACVWEVF